MGIAKHQFDALRAKQAELGTVVDAETTQVKTLGDLDAKVQSLELRLDSALRDRNATFESVKALETALETAKREREELACTPLPECDKEALLAELGELLAELSPVEVISRADRLADAVNEED